MRRNRGEVERMVGEGKLIAVAIDKDKGSQYALKWAVDHLLKRGESLTLLHVNTNASFRPSPSSVSKGAPEFCSVFVIGKGKIQSVRSASAALPIPSNRNQMETQASKISEPTNPKLTYNRSSRGQTPDLTSEQVTVYKRQSFSWKSIWRNLNAGKRHIICQLWPAKHRSDVN